MAAQHLSLPVDFSGRALLLGDPGDVLLLDGRTADRASVSRQVAAAVGGRPVGIRLADPSLVGEAVAAGAALVLVTVAAVSTHEVRTAARAGVAVVLAGDPEPGRLAGIDLLANGGRPGRVVVEVPVMADAGPIDVDLVHRVEGTGLVVGAVLLSDSEPVDEAAGWEIAMVTRLLQLGVRTIRNVPAARFQRVSAVVDALAEARVASGDQDQDQDQDQEPRPTGSDR